MHTHRARESAILTFISTHIHNKYTILRPFLSFSLFLPLPLPLSISLTVYMHIKNKASYNNPCHIPCDVWNMFQVLWNLYISSRCWNNIVVVVIFDIVRPVYICYVLVEVLFTLARSLRISLWIIYSEVIHISISAPFLFAWTTFYDILLVSDRSNTLHSYYYPFSFVFFLWMLHKIELCVELPTLIEDIVQPILDKVITFIRLG